ncbi:MAG: ATP-dependent DNA helicase RecG [Magnetococcus sp. WYHC-3]
MPEEKKADELDSVLKIPFVGPAQASALARLGIKSVEDILQYAPRDVLDLRNPLSINGIHSKFGEKVAVYGEISGIKLIKTPRKRIWILSAKLSDTSGEIEAVWFNQPYLRNFFKSGQKYLFYGNLEYSFLSKKPALASPQVLPKPDVYPLYPLTRGLSSRQLSRFVKSAVSAGYKLQEFVPKTVLSEFRLPDLESATKNLHFPADGDAFALAKERFNFNHLLVFILANLYLNAKTKQAKGFKIEIEHDFIESFISELPFELTADQKKAVEEILADLERGYPMNRIVQGDVGSGKTIVALVASLAVIRAGYKVVWLAPTEILANQHFETAKKFSAMQKVEIALLTSSSKHLEAEACRLKPDLIIATHAAFYQKLPEDVALVVVDEQHRFGVEQREALAEKKKIRPHFLSLSATPIPRSLAHIVFGNLDISTILSKPSGRKSIKTYLVPEEKRQSSYEFINGLVAKGQQIFVICPLIQARQGDLGEGLELFSPTAERKTVEEEVGNLRKTVLGKRKIAALHGKMKSSEKEKTMLEMQGGKIDILVSTSVVEVGIDIKNATVMVVEDAEHFGLSQLHQFRGRVGRSDLQSYCFLFSKNSDNPRTKERLKAFVQNFDGFKLAQMDLKQRGPGALLGLEQSGFKGFNPLWFEKFKIIVRDFKDSERFNRKIR